MARDLGVPVTREGDFYFISYNSGDAERISGIIRELDRLRMPMWYDKMLPFGSADYRKDLSIVLSNSKAIIMFVSAELFYNKENSGVYIEYDEAEKLGKTIYLVYLDEISISKVRMEYRIWYVKCNRRQSLRRYHYGSDQEFAKEIYEKIKESEELRSSEKKKSYDDPSEPIYVPKKRQIKRKAVIGILLLLLSGIMGTGAYQIYQHKHPKISIEDRSYGYTIDQDFSTLIAPVPEIKEEQK